MAIYAIGAYYDEDVSELFISNNIAGPGWDAEDAPELHQFIKTLKVGDFIYIKSAPPSSKDIIVKAIGVVMNETIMEISNVVSIGRNIKWLVTESFRVARPKEKNNVRMNTMYEEFHPIIQDEILNKIF
ncbi:hypothetical protein PCO82_04485 [Pectobacteriaceae bacterium CE90]|nr:hypothetical protein [Prodigiosinella sp. LS101]WJV53023.1 hypothetical protein PCO85_17775 [Prodigiosinella sp. LS101]WJV57378.1 hypothetical protein PCO84_17750 [Pectobacteriaceae bacterium C111]WJY15950.1 hypothetical protein PCO82_04485 [Pectobacteriaceae bacterium CE90]